jgi:plasmid stability protein
MRTTHTRKSAAVQYTVRNVPSRVDRLLRQRASDSKRSFNEVLVQALTLGSGLTGAACRDLSDVAGTLSDRELAAMDQAIATQRVIDPKMWR